MANIIHDCVAFIWNGIMCILNSFIIEFLNLNYHKKCESCSYVVKCQFMVKLIENTFCMYSLSDWCRFFYSSLDFRCRIRWYKGLIKVTTVYQITWHKRVKSIRHSWWINLIKSLALPISISSRVTKVYAQHKRTATFSTRIRVYFKIP